MTMYKTLKTIGAAAILTGAMAIGYV